MHSRIWMRSLCAPAVIVPYERALFPFPARQKQQTPCQPVTQRVQVGKLDTRRLVLMNVLRRDDASKSSLPIHIGGNVKEGKSWNIATIRKISAKTRDGNTSKSGGVAVTRFSVENS